MANKFSATSSVNINAPGSAVWDALINPAKIRRYLHDSNAVSDWKEGSSLEFRGEWKGKSYVDKGVIVKTQPNELLQYTWLSSSSGLEDKPENYALITYKISNAASGTTLTLTQDNIKTEEAKQQSISNWNSVLQDLKGVVEEQPVDAVR